MALVHLCKNIKAAVSKHFAVSQNAQLLKVQKNEDALLLKVIYKYVNCGSWIHQGFTAYF